MNFSFFLFYFDCILPGAKVAVASQSWSRQPTKLTRRPFLPFANNNNNNSKKKRETNKTRRTWLCLCVCPAAFVTRLWFPMKPIHHWASSNNQQWVSHLPRKRVWRWTHHPFPHQGQYPNVTLTRANEPQCWGLVTTRVQTKILSFFLFWRDRFFRFF